MLRVAVEDRRRRAGSSTHRGYESRGSVDRPHLAPDLHSRDDMTARPARVRRRPRIFASRSRGPFGRRPRLSDDATLSASPG